MFNDEPKKAAYVTVKPSGKIVVETPYNADFVEEIKRNFSRRNWDPDNKAWIISGLGSYGYRLVTSLVKAYFRDIPAYLIEGNVTTNIHTGEVVTQLAFFE